MEVFLDDSMGKIYNRTRSGSDMMIENRWSRYHKGYRVRININHMNHEKFIYVSFGKVEAILIHVFSNLLAVNRI